MKCSNKKTQTSSMDTKTRSTYMLSTRNPLYVSKDTESLRGWKNIFHANRKQKKAGVAILISDKIDLKVKTITRDKEGHNIGAPQYTRQTLTDIKGETDSNNNSRKL